MSPETAAQPEAPARAAGRLRTVLLLWAAALAAADLAIKSSAEALLSTAATIDLGPVNIRLLYNPGVAFSLGADLPSWVIIAATA